MSEENVLRLFDLLRSPDPSPPYVAADRLTADDLYAAIAKVRDSANYEIPPSMDAMHPDAHDACNDLLGRPRGTPLTHADRARAQQALYDRCTPEEKRRLVGMVLADSGWR